MSIHAIWARRPALASASIPAAPAGGTQSVVVRAELEALRADLVRLRTQLDQLVRQASTGRPASPGLAWPPPAPPAAPPVPAPPPPPPPAPVPAAPPRAEKPVQHGSGPTLREGLKGKPVRELQERLQALGFDPGPIDGLFGPRTEKAVRAFQRKHDLEVDGIVGKQTWGALGIDVKGEVSAWGPGHVGADGMVPGASIPLVTRQGKQMHAALAKDWDRMVEAAERDGVSLVITSGYRSVAHQAELFREAVRKYGSEDAARKWVAPPGKSNHQLGKALDIADQDGAHAWLRRNGHRFGFNQPMSWEPWHWEHDI